MKYKDYLNKNLAEYEIISDEYENKNAWIEILSEEGYVYNEYADEVLSIFSGLKIKGRGKTSNNYVELYFNPVYYASGEFDRMSIYNNAADDILFPVGGLYDYTMFIGKTGVYYIADWKNLYKCGDSIDSFLFNIFSGDPELSELYCNEC
ncbi:MAG: SUKH-3 domain-containing protein [Lachnospiraceae bacterium]|nr:SUKH-3 domain-containing protein [Lachnospiraceae bacterium]